MLLVTFLSFVVLKKFVKVLGGNIMTASPISDINPILMASESEAIFKTQSCNERKVLMNQSFFPSYRKTSAHPGEVLIRVRIPFTEQVIFSNHEPAFKLNKIKGDESK